jgi:DNA-binding transcriptional regulator YhcF (GntR family)
VEARYQQIAADIRHRISTGALRAGDRVPSARQITREWGVAIATATRVLAVLRDEGLVRTAPGAGTVVAEQVAPPVRTDRRRAGRAPETNLTRDRVVSSAIAIADAEGLAALSMRRVAVDLGVATMSLYRHVPGKTELVHLMVDVVFAEQEPSGSAGRGWRPQLEALARVWWRIVRRHPWLVGTGYLVRPRLVPNGVSHADRATRAAASLGLDRAGAARTSAVLAGYVQGMAAYLEPADGTDARGRTADRDLDGRFEFGLALLLDGLAGRRPPGRRH